MITLNVQNKVKMPKFKAIFFFLSTSDDWLSTESLMTDAVNNIEKINKDNFPKGTQVTVDDKGNVTITYSDKSKDMIKSEMLAFQESKGASTEIEKPKKPISEITKANLPKNKAKLPKTGIESQGSIILSLIASAVGVFALKKRK